MLSTSIKQFRYYKHLADNAMSQLPGKEYYFHQQNREDNSIAVMINHLAGNMKSRWTNIFTEDGEKPWRNRDAEFLNLVSDADKLKLSWEEGWNCLFNTLEKLTENDLETIIYIRNEGLTVQDAILRQLCHYSYHTGQIVTKSKQLTNGIWESLSIPRNESSQYNKAHFSKEKQKRHFLDNLLDKKDD